jgi:hypothetical protein
MKNKYFCKLLATIILTFGWGAMLFVDCVGATTTCASTTDVPDPVGPPPEYRLPMISIDGSFAYSGCAYTSFPSYLNSDDNNYKSYDSPVKCIFPDASTKTNGQITGGVC